jgi:hypothetical protein
MHAFFTRLLKVSLLCLSVCASYGQHPYEVKVTSENDNYCLQYHDGYYTNGLFLSFTYLPVRLNSRIQEADRLVKITSSYRAGQMIFTPGSVVPTITRDLMDRPYTGYLFAEKSMTFFYKKGHVLKTAFSVGTIGPNALGQQAQLFIHETFDLIRPKGWNYQLKNEVGLNLQGQYLHELMPESWRNSWFDAHATAQAMVGNTFTNASAGLLFQVGRFARTHQSSLYDAQVEGGQATSRRATELYAFFRPSYQYQFYNATVQGGMFTDNKGAILSPVRRWVYSNDIGLVFAKPRWTFQMMYSFREREAATMRYDEQYVGLTLAYRFGK